MSCDSKLCIRIEQNQYQAGKGTDFTPPTHQSNLHIAK